MDINQNPNQTSGEKARNFRLEKTMQTLRDMILNMDRQEKMGVPVDPVEKQLFAQIGKALKSLQGKDDMDFNLEGAVIVRKLTGAAPFASNTAYNQNPHQGAQTAPPPPGSVINGYADPFATGNPNQGYQQQAQQPNYGQQAQQGFNANQGAGQGAYGGGAPKPGFNPLGHFKNNGKGIGPSDSRYLAAASQKLGGIGMPQDYINMAGEIAEILVNEHQFPQQESVDVACQAMMQLAQQGIRPDEIIGMRVLKGITSKADPTNGVYSPFGQGNKSPLDVFNEILAEGEAQMGPIDFNNETDSLDTGF